MEAFVESHLKLVELERTEEISNSQLLLSSSPKVLESKGLCLQRMRLTNLRTGLYGRTIAEFEHHFGSPPRDLPANTFSSGDLVGIYSERAPFPACGDDGGVITAVMLRLSARATSLVLDDAMHAENLTDDGMYRLVKLGSDVTYKRIKKGLITLQTKSRDSPASHLVDVLFNESPPASTPPLPTPTFFNTGLDDSQREAVTFALARPDVAVIHGPPGTGKTTTVVELIRQAILPQHGHRKSRILACAPSNVAVDNLVERLAAAQPQPRIVRLGHAARVMSHIQKYSLEARLTNSDGWQLVKDVQQEMDGLRQRMARKRTAGRDKKDGDKGASVKLRHEMTELRKELRQREAKALQEIYDRSEVVLATLTGLHEDKTLSKVEFDLVIIDECSQSVEAACWLALLRGPRCVLAGDHLQLPPTVVSKEACKGGLELSLMERVLRLYPGDQVTRMLTTQYRMHADIMGWSADQFYEGKLEAHPSVAGHGLSDLPHVHADDEEEMRAAVVLIDTAGCGVTETVVEQSRGNVGEAELVRFFVERRISGCGLRQEDVGVITPYNLQVELIRNRLKPQFPALEIRTVDGFQGREKEVIVLSLVRSNAQAEVGFLAEHRRLNVAVTRARRQVVVICDTDTLTRSKDAVLGRFVEYLRQRASVVRTAQELIDSGDVDVGTVMDCDFAGLEDGDGRKPAAKKKQKNKKGKKEPRGEGSSRTASGRPSTGKPQPQDGRAKREVKEEAEEEEYRQQLLTFKASDQTEKSFPDMLSGRQRAVIHELAESLNLIHISVGEGKERHLIVKKGPPEPTKNESRILDPPREASGRETASAPSAQDGATATPGAPSAQDGATVTPGAPSAQDGATATPGPPTAVQGAAAAIPDPPIAAQGPPTVPEANPGEDAIMRQLREYREREHLRRQQQLREEQQKKRESHRAAKAARSGAALAGVPDDDFDALIAAATALDSVCAHAECSVKVKTLGHHCSLCSRRFCSSHRLPESHGCGKAVREEARKVISREGRIYAGSGVPSKKMDPTKRAHLERKLDKRIDEMTTQRKSKEKKKK